MRHNPTVALSKEEITAILEGRKTMLRRVVRQDVFNFNCNDSELGTDLRDFWIVGSGAGSYETNKDGVRKTLNDGYCAFGKVGDQIWVKESFWVLGRYSSVGSKIEGKVFERNISDNGTATVSYEEDMPDSSGDWLWVKKPPKFMTKDLSRLLFEIKSIRVERIQDITQEDAKAEGVIPCPHRPASEGCKQHADGSTKRDCYCCSYRVAWNKKNGKEGNAWDENPYVWVIKFSLLSQTNL